MDKDDFSDFFYTSHDGLKLHARLYGEGHAGIPVVCLPGLTRNVRDFHELALFLANRPQKPRKIICFDYRGRGLSVYDPDWNNYNVGVEANDVIAGLEALGVLQAAFIGTSRGGLIVHVLAMLRPALIKAAILNDIGPVIGAEGLEQIRSYLTDAQRPTDFDQAVAIQKSIHADAFPALTEDDWQRFVRAIYRSEKGLPIADYDPALIKTVLGMDLEQKLPDLWAQFELLADLPLLAIRGANSRLLSAETLVEMGNRHPAMEAITVAGQGHAPFPETGDLPDRIAAFLDRAEAGLAQDADKPRFRLEAIP